MNISIATLRTFVTVANAGNIIDAAHSLGRSPSAISMTLKQLEEHLGRPLFEGDRKSQLTALGNYVLQRAQREVDHYVKTIRSIENYARSEIGQIFIASVPSFSTLILPEVVGRFLGRFPNIGLDISDMESHSVARAVDEGAAEIGIASVMDLSIRIETLRERLKLHPRYLPLFEGGRGACSNFPVLFAEPRRGDQLTRPALDLTTPER